MLVGALDPSAWTGLVICSGPGCGFAFRFIIECDGKRFDGYELLETVHRIGPHAPDGSFARISFDTRLPASMESDSMNVDCSNPRAAMAIEWAQVNDNTCVGEVHMKASGTLEFRAYFPWDWSGSWSLPNHGMLTPYGGCLLRGATTAEREELEVRLLRTTPGTAVIPPPNFAAGNAECWVRLSMQAGESVQFTAVMTDRDGIQDGTGRSAICGDQVGKLLGKADETYAANRVTVDRHWDGLGESITNNLHWMVSLKPETGKRYTPAGRRWIFPRHGGGSDHWTVFCWDAFFNALELSLESPELASDTLSSVLETQYANGNIPNWRGRFFGTRDRSQPPIGSFVVLKMFLRTGDREMLERAFPVLDRWSSWWRAPKGVGQRRDGNGNGLFEWGCDLDLLRYSPAPWENGASPHQLAAWESGQDDLPNWDEAAWKDGAETLDLESVDLNSLLALDFDCLCMIATALGLREKANEYAKLYRTLSNRINDVLWDEDRGMYVDRFWDGRFSTRLAASNFYPLVAGIAPQNRAERMLTTLLSEEKFWGRFVLPTISRDDAAFADQQYWRGTIWPPTNYLVYQGLRRYRFDETAAQLAQRSVDLFLTSWRRFQVCRENYDSRTGEGGGQKYQSWGPLFALMGIEEFIDVTPWDGLRIGTLSPPPATKLDNIPIRGRRWTVSLSPTALHVSVDGQELLTSASPMVLRQFEFANGEIRAHTASVRAVNVAVSLGTDIVSICVDGASCASPATAVLIPAGQHSVSITPAPHFH